MNNINILNNIKGTTLTADNLINNSHNYNYLSLSDIKYQNNNNMNGNCSPGLKKSRACSIKKYKLLKTIGKGFYSK